MALGIPLAAHLYPYHQENHTPPPAGLPLPQPCPSLTSLPAYTEGGQPPPYIIQYPGTRYFCGRPIPYTFLIGSTFILGFGLFILMLNIKLPIIPAIFMVILTPLVAPFCYILFMLAKTTLERKRGTLGEAEEEYGGNIPGVD
ncbi:hypothetical protein HOY80DRAFT_990565, partial [Tuber brumale]